jgi:uncharacterized protein YceK
MIIARFTLYILLGMFCSGCGTIANHPDKGSVEYPGRVAYEGVRMDWETGKYIYPIGYGPFSYLDMPFSAVFDTLCLPSDLYTTHKWTRDVKAYQESLKCNPPDPDPLTGWKCDFDVRPVQPDKVIADDLQDYIQTLPPEQKQAFIECGGVKNHYLVKQFEDGSGQHAIRFEILLNSRTIWKHVLIYDKSNKRIKVLKYENDHLRT